MSQADDPAVTIPDAADSDETPTTQPERPQDSGEPGGQAGEPKTTEPEPEPEPGQADAPGTSAPGTPGATDASDPGTHTPATAGAGDSGGDTPGSPSDDEDPQRRTTTVEHPAKVMRIGTMIKQLLDEVKASPLDDAARERLAAIHTQSVKELEEGLSPELVEELERLSLPFTENQTPSDAELRIAQAQLVGWLEGLFHGLQTALVAQQMAAQAQLTGMRRELPPGVSVDQLPPGVMIQRRADDDRGGREHGTGQYL